MEELIVKLIRDNHVAVLVSSGFGAGWSTWNYDYPQMLFDPTIAEMLEGDETNEEELFKKIEAYCSEKYPDAYLGGLDGLYVEWLPVGTAFRIHEYDGAESIDIRDEMNWTVA